MIFVSPLSQIWAKDLPTLDGRFFLNETLRNALSSRFHKSSRYGQRVTVKGLSTYKESRNATLACIGAIFNRVNPALKKLGEDLTAHPEQRDQLLEQYIEQVSHAEPNLAYIISNTQRSSKLLASIAQGLKEQPELLQATNTAENALTQANKAVHHLAELFRSKQNG